MPVVTKVLASETVDHETAIRKAADILRAAGNDEDADELLMDLGSVETEPPVEAVIVVTDDGPPADEPSIVDVIEAQTAAQVDVIEAETAQQVELMETAAEIREEETEALAEALGEITPEPAPEPAPAPDPDPAPRTRHFFYRPWFSRGDD